MTRAAGILLAHLVPRLLKREWAAPYVGVGTTKFLEMVVDGRMPPPKRVDTLTLWDRLELDEAVADLPSDADADANTGDPLMEALDDREA